MYGSISTEVLKQWREEMLREAELGRLVRVSRAGRMGPTVPPWASTVAWEVARVDGFLHKYVRAPKGVG